MPYRFVRKVDIKKVLRQRRYLAAPTKLIKYHVHIFRNDGASVSVELPTGKERALSKSASRVWVRPQAGAVVEGHSG
jgi:hypothetical protein